MKDLYKIIMENTLSGKIDKQVSVQILKKLMNQTEESTVDNDIAIIGVGLKLPGANTIEEFWNNLSDGVDSVGELSEVRKRDVEKYIHNTKVPFTNFEYMKAGFLEDIDKFDYKFFNISPKEACLMNPNQRIFLETVWKAIEDGGYGGNRLVGTRTGVYVGASSDAIFDYKRLIYEIDTSTYSNAVLGNLTAVTASRISYLLNLSGPSMTIDSTCSSSLVAIHSACKAIHNGECDMAIAGSVKLELVPLKKEFELGIESEDGIVRAFDDNCNGTGIGEGVAAILLKPLDKAIKDRDCIYAVIKGSVVNQDGQSAGISAPSPIAQAEVIMKAWKDSKVDPKTISYIEAHGTGTKLGDPIEVSGMQKAFKKYTNRRQFCAIGSVKSNIGHLYESAGIAGLIKTVLILKYKKIPPTIHFARPNREINFIDSPVYINDRLVKIDTADVPLRCGVSSFGISGTNCHIVLEEAPRIEQGVNDNPVPYNIWTISAKSKTSLKNLLLQYSKFLERAELPNIEDLCFTANTGRGHYNYRCAIIAADSKELYTKVKLLISNLGEIPHSDIYYGYHKIVPLRKKEREVGEIIDSEQSVLTKLADEKIVALETGNNPKEIIQEILKLYTKGACIEWEKIYCSYTYKKVVLPVYEFDKHRCWMGSLAEKKENNSELYCTKWIRKSLEADYKQTNGAILLFHNLTELGGKISNLLQDRNVIAVKIANAYRKIDDQHYEVGCSEQDYIQLFSEYNVKVNVHEILHFATINHAVVESIAELREKQEHGVQGLFYLIKALKKNEMERKIAITLVSEYATNVTGSDKLLKPENAMFLGLGKSLIREYPWIHFKLIDMDKESEVDNIVHEMRVENDSVRVAYRKNERYVEIFDSISNSSMGTKELSIKSDGAYVITGGLGGIGIEIAKFIALKNAANIVIITRTELPARQEWNAILKKSQNDGLSKKIRSIIELEALGARVGVYSVDVADLKQMKITFDEIRNTYQKINGVFHCAGISNYDMVESQGTEQFLATLRPKVEGTYVLNKVTREDKLDYFILFSSIASVFSTAGQGAYSAANAYLDSFAEYVRAEGRRAIAINWVAWEKIGMSKEFEYKGKRLFHSISSERAIQAFETILRSECRNVIVGDMNLEQETVPLFKSFPFYYSTELQRKLDSVRMKEKKVHVKNQKTDVLLQGRIEGNFTDMEVYVANVWAEALGLDQINIYDGFFEMGGDSILAMKIVNEISKKWGIELSVTEIMNCLTIAEFAECLEAKQKTKNLPHHARIAKAEKKDVYLMSPAQRRLYILNQSQENSINYNVPINVLIDGHLDVKRLEYAFVRLIERHESLRTNFTIVEGELVQKISEAFTFHLEYCEQDAGEIELHDFVKPFELSRGLLFRAKLIKVEELTYRLFLDMHHIITDAVSILIILQEVVQLYQGEELPALRIQYKDYSEWYNRFLESDSMKVHKEYWLEQFSGQLPELKLPTDYNRPNHQSLKGSTYCFELEKQQTIQLHELSTRSSTSLYMVLLSAYYILLYKYSACEDIIVGTPVVGRHYPDLDNIIGMFVNTLALRAYPQENKQYSDFLQEVKTCVIKAFENQDYPFEDIVGNIFDTWESGRNPLFDTMFVLQNNRTKKIEIDGIKFKQEEANQNISKFDIRLEAVDSNQGIRFYMEYNTELFKEKSISNMADDYLKILNCIVNNNNIILKDIRLERMFSKRQSVLQDEIKFDF